MLKNLMLISSLVLLAGCSMTLPVRGQVQGTKEIFTGTATGYLDRSGDLSITSNKGAICKGSFVYVSAREGSGVFDCNDGRTGPFTFVSTGSRGNGHGSLGDQAMTFTFGD